jgi:glycosyltransferase involved in cell wall biosynthesis
MEYLGESKPVNSIEPLVSVCVPTFQHEKFIEECLASILNQKTDFPFEILIGEDESPDRTREICKKIAFENQDKIRLFLRKDSKKIKLFGKKAGRGNQLGLYGSARGKYVAFCDGDDFWFEPLKLQKQVDALESYPEAYMCITNYSIGNNEGEVKVPQGNKIFTKKEHKKMSYFGHVSCWLVRNRMNLLLKNRIIEKPLPLDAILFAFYKQMGDIFYLSDITSVYRYNPNGLYLSQTNKNKHLVNISNAWYKFRYIDKDFTHFFRSFSYELKRYFAHLIN